jgi:hypothetical protein
MGLPATILSIIVNNNNNNKGKTFPLQALWGPEGSGRLRVPDSMTSALKVVGC